MQWEVYMTCVVLLPETVNVNPVTNKQPDTQLVACHPGLLKSVMKGIKGTVAAFSKLEETSQLNAACGG